MNPSVSGRRFLRTLWLVGLAIALMLGIDKFLANTEAAEVRIEAQRLFTEGENLLNAGKFAEAASRLSDALAIQRDNRDYQLALATAQFDDAQYTEAEHTLNALLTADSTLGPANLAMARVLLKEGHVREATSYYHRAVYGEWKDDPQGNRSRTRFELIDVLAAQNSKEELLAELLAVEDEAPTDVGTQMRMGKLFLEAGSAARAGDIFREILKRDRHNADAYAGLGESEFARGDYRAAIADYAEALRFNPQNKTAAARLDLSNRVLDLDPTQRGLDSGERLRRSRELLEMTLPCLGNKPAPPDDDLSISARKLLAERVNPARQEQAAEAALDLAEQIWKVCNKGGAVSGDDPLSLVMTRVAAAR